MTTKKNNSGWLIEEIRRLEQKETMQINLLKLQGHEILQSLKPSSLVKSALGTVVISKGLKKNVIDTSLGIGAGLLARKWYVGASKNIFKKLAGFILQNITTGVITKKMPAVREKISSFTTK